MQFGVVEDVAGIDFALPPVDPVSRWVLTGAPAARPAVHVGGTQWGVRGWVGSVYPAGARERDLLVHYGRQFNTVELNATHYGVPDPAIVARWRESVPPGFTFAPKFPRAVSHAPDLTRELDAAQAFCERMRGLGDRLGRAFLQLPPQFGPERLGELAALLHALPRDFPLAVEARHPRLFTARRLRPELASLLAGRRVAAVQTDTPGRRDVLHGTLTAPSMLLRFVGTGVPAVDTWRMEAWARRVRRLLSVGLEEVHVFLHMPSEQLTAEASRAWVHRLNATCGLALSPWREPAGEQLPLWESP